MAEFSKRTAEGVHRISITESAPGLFYVTTDAMRALLAEAGFSEVMAEVEDS